MERQDFDEFVTVLDAAMGMYDKQPPSGFAQSIWWNSLKSYTLQEVKAGFSRHIRNPDNGQFAPKPADIVRAIGGTSSDNAVVAWSKVDKTVRSIGAYRDVIFDDAYIHAVIGDMGGWVKLCTGHDDEAWPHVQREFENRYRGFMTRRQAGDYPRQLVGITNATNRQMGRTDKLQHPAVIGDMAKAQAVFSGGATHLINTPVFKQLENVIDLQTRRLGGSQ